MMLMLSQGAGSSEPHPTWRPTDVNWGRYIEQIAAGQQQALARLYDETSRLIYGVVLRILGDPADAEEVALDVYSQVWRSAATYRPARGAPSTWLLMMARSRALDRLRSRDSRRLREAALDEVAEVRSAEDPPEEAAALSQERRRVRTAMQSLAPEQRQAIEMAFFGGLTHSELAARLGEPLGTVKTRIRLGMMKLREALGSGQERSS